MIVTLELITDIILVIQGHFQSHFQGQKFNVKVKIMKKRYLANANMNKCNRLFLCDFDQKRHQGSPEGAS